MIQIWIYANQAEEKKHLLSDNFGEFLIELSKNISIKNENRELRQINTTIIKNMVISIKNIMKNGL